jgi:hypothetical protein
MLAVAGIAAVSLGACNRFRHHEPTLAPAAAIPPRDSGPPPVVPAPAPPPGRLAHMICRSSVDGRKVACGTPNAVMVGMKYD